MRALALKRSSDFGNKASGRLAKQAMTAAVSAGGRNVFFTRLRLSVARIEGEAETTEMDGDDDLFAAWDRLMDRYGTTGPRFDRWAGRLLDDLRSDDHDTVARAIAQLGEQLLGLGAAAPRATSGEEDAYWELAGPRRLITFEVKLAPQVKSVVNDDVEQAEGAAKAAEVDRGYEVRGLLVTPYDRVEDTAAARLERVRLVTIEVLADQVEKVISILRSYRREWSENAADRGRARAAAVSDLPPVDLFWRAVADVEVWVDEAQFDSAWADRPS
jgi:hypothetical protein